MDNKQILTKIQVERDKINEDIKDLNSQILILKDRQNWLDNLFEDYKPEEIKKNRIRTKCYGSVKKTVMKIIREAEKPLSVKQITEKAIEAGTWKIVPKYAEGSVKSALDSSLPRQVEISKIKHGQTYINYYSLKNTLCSD